MVFSIGHSAALQDILELILKNLWNPLVVYICGGHAHMPATARGCLKLVRSFLVQWEAPFAVKGFSSCIGRSVVTSSPFLATQHGYIWLHLSRLRQHFACAAGFRPAVMKATACVLVLAACLAVAVQAQNFDRATRLCFGFAALEGCSVSTVLLDCANRSYCLGMFGGLQICRA